MPRPKKNRLAAVPDTPSAQLFAEKPQTPTIAKRFLDDSASEDEFHSAVQSPDQAGFKVNTEYARRFEHNKKREELQRLEEKYGNDSSLKRRREDDEYDSEDDSSSSEDEDETAVLATEDLDKEIFATLAAIKNKDPRVYDGKTSFYSTADATADAAPSTEKTEKPMYLRDYHRENLLAGNTGEEEEEEPRTFVQQQQDLKRSVVKEIHSVADADGSGNDDDDDGFLVRKPSAKNSEDDAKLDLPDPATADPNNPDEYLHKFLSSRAWTKVSGTSHVAIQSDDSESDAEAEAFEHTYNMRFEDPEARAKLVSYGRDTVNANTVRREEKSRRKKARDEKRKRKDEENEIRDVEKNRLRKLKTDELIEKIKKIKEAAGIEELDPEAEADVFSKVLEGDFSDGEWESWMQGRFGDSYYADKDPMKKPEFDDDIDIKDIIPDFSDDALEDDEEDDDALDEEEEERPRKKAKRDLIKEKQDKKQKDKSMRRKLERFVEENYDVDDKLSTFPKSSGFRYRETTPETYGLTPLDILAAGDADLNNFAGLKKYASFRDAEKKEKDRKRLTKKKRLKQWRKEVFGDAEGVKMPADWKPEGLVQKAVVEDKGGESNIREAPDGEKKKKRRRKNKGKA
ncbi:KRI1-like family C-terminal-domain-containing protein [Geopyxis carbonaria]|nr:KRI1-like family C-terminal-domain-containing protein [Geopyxis carbonaria]